MTVKTIKFNILKLIQFYKIFFRLFKSLCMLLINAKALYSGIFAADRP